jgi:hypothetical protein
MMTIDFGATTDTSTDTWVPDGFPETVYALAFPGGLHGILAVRDAHHGQVDALAVFSTPGRATLFCDRLGASGGHPQEMTFDEARELAKSKPPQVVALAMADDWDAPVVLYVK